MTDKATLRDSLESVRKSGKAIKYGGMVIAILGVIAAFIGGSIESEAEKGLLILDQGKLDQMRLK